MRKVLCLIAVLGQLALPCAASSKSERKNREKAEKEYVAAMDSVRAGDLARARDLIEHVLQLDPSNIPALTAHELLRQNEIREKIRQGSKDVESNRTVEAIGAFRAALALDPKNADAQQGLRSALGETVGGLASGREPIRYRDADDIHLEPQDTPHDFHFKGDTRGFLEQVWNAYGIRPLIDSSVLSKQVRFDIQGADFATAINIASQMSDTFYVPVAENQALIFSDTPENRKNYERLALRTFYIGGDASTPQDINDAVTMLRSIFDFRFVTP